MEAFTFAVSTQVDFPIHIKMYVPDPVRWSYPMAIRTVGQISKEHPTDSL